MIKNYFDVLNGLQLSAVTFVQDYLQFQFDGPGMNVYNPVTVSCDQKEIKNVDDQFRNALCGQIGKIVSGVALLERESLIIKFADNSMIKISLKDEDYSFPEAVNFSGFDVNNPDALLVI